MKINRINYIRQTILMISILGLMSCSNNDNGTDTAINVQDLIRMTIDENPQTGQAIGIINATSNNPIAFSILEQDFTDAIVINPNSGEVTVGDASFFDFETILFVQAIVEINNGIETVTTNLRIDINNIDDIAFFLTTSKQNYINAQAGEWIEVTEAEYNNLATNLNEVTKIATSDADYDNTELPSTIFSTSADNTIANNNGETMPSGSYVFAFKYISGGITTAMRAKQSSTDIATDYENIGSNFPMSPASGSYYLVLKTSNAPTTGVGYLAMYSPIKTFRNYPSSITNSGSGDANMLPDLLSNNLFLYQGLSSTQRQWD